MYLLPRSTYVEPRKCIALELRHWAWGEAESCTVEVVSMLERRGRDDEVDMVDAGYHVDEGVYLVCLVAMKTVRGSEYGGVVMTSNKHRGVATKNYTVC